MSIPVEYKKYEDPVNTKEIIEHVISLTEQSEIYEYISFIFPGWILHSTDHYSDDYDYLENNWKQICDLGKVKKAQIVLVDFIDFQENLILIKLFCEIMTRHGYTVRRKEEFIGCSKCGKGIATSYLWKIMFQKGLPVPNKWSSTCTKC
jgi:hypothetical protein